MRWRHRGGVVALSLVALFALLSSGALAYFSNPSAGNAQAAVTQLGAPAIATATPSSSTVALIWDGVLAPGEGAVRYYVTRDGGDAGGTCSTQANPAANLSCTDLEVPPGDHTYEVTAVWKSWTAASEPVAVTVAIGAASKFTIAASTATPVAGEPVDLTITARDAGGGVVASYAGNKTLRFSGAEAGPDGTKPTVVNRSGKAIPFGSNTSLTFTAGVASVASNRNGVLQVYRAGTAEIQATQGSTLDTPVPLALTVSPASAAEIALTAASATPTAGVDDELTITANDEYGNVATSYAGAKELVFSGAEASPAGNEATVTDLAGQPVAFGSATALSFTDGVAAPDGGANGALAIYKDGAANVKAVAGPLATPAALALTVAPGAAAKLSLSASATSIRATSSTNLTTTAQDPYGNTATSYTGNKNLVFSGAAASPSGTDPTVTNRIGTAVSFGDPTSLSFSSGVAAVSSGRNGLTRLPWAEAASVSASDGAISTATPLSFAVSPGAANRVAFDGLTANAGTIGSPCLFTCPVSGLGNSGTISSAVMITDSLGNLISDIGTATTVTVGVTKGGTITGSPLSIPASGPAITAADFLYTAPANGKFSHTITAASSGYSSATSAVTK